MNMGYCRFRNTLQDLRDCVENWYELEEYDTEERGARKEMLALCKHIAEEHDDEEED